MQKVNPDLINILQSQFLSLGKPLGLLRLGVRTAAPSNPQSGDVVYADGTSWDPGSGEGIYRYSVAGSWVFIG